MNIVFLCGSLDPGKDGVGDYTRRLAGELIRQGNSCTIVAIMDKGVQERIDEIQESEFTPITVLRLPISNGYQLNCIEAKPWVDNFNPDWISLQYVPFSFHSKGLPFGLGKSIQQLNQGRKLHIMFHELWIDRTRGNPLKKKILSYFQQYQTYRLASMTKPLCVHTHLPLYQRKLWQINIDAKPLPLFSNFKTIEKLESKKETTVFKMAFFSQIRTLPAIFDFINAFSLELLDKGFSPELVLIGGNKVKMESMVSIFKMACPDLNSVTYTGFLDESAVLKTIGECDLGISPVPQHVIGKSGSVAAFFSQTVPVAAPVVQNTYKEWGIGFFLEEEMNSVLLKPTWNAYLEVKKTVRTVPDKINISTVISMFSSDLKSVEKPI
ncbi:hypothetical protein [Flavobacterium sp. WC2429]|uniref:Glycosyltransferase n=1 Tax=Flavobacterium sp. WC2429 TaxID=3234140 RepID=A0AB39WMZ1_9FLAO